LYEKLEKGTSFDPSTTEDVAYVVPWPEHIANLTRWFFEGKMIDSTRFGVPSGSGKTYLMTKLCNEYKSSYLYHKILEPDSFVTGLSETVGMKVAPSTILDVMLLYFTGKYTCCFNHSGRLLRNIK